MGFIEEVSTLVRDFLSKNNVSINWLSKRSGVAYSTARAIAQREVGDARTDTIVCLLSVFMSHADIINLLVKHGRDDKLRSMYEAHKSYQYLRKDADQSFRWKAPDHIIVSLAATEKGTTRERIQDCFGKDLGLERLSALLEAGVLVEDKGKVKSFSENFTDPDIHSVAEQTAIHAESWDVAQIEAGGFNVIKSHDLSKEAFEDVKDVMRDAVNKIYQIVERDKNNEKDVVMLLNLLCSVYGANQ